VNTLARALPRVRPLGRPVGLPRADRALVVGVLNVTPDSFSDGGRWLEPAVAVARGTALVADGADLVDVGGESTRPGARRVPADVELARVVPVVEALVRAGVVVSVDTMRAAVAQAALDAGAVLVNDVSGGLADPQMYPLVARTGTAYVAVHTRSGGEKSELAWSSDPAGGEEHRRGGADRTGVADRCGDVVAQVRAGLAARVAAMRAAGIRDEQVVLDPGLGFGTTRVQDWALAARVGELVADGFPVLVGASRKRFLGALLAGADGTWAPPSARDDATAAVSALAAAAGAWAVRVHDVRPSADAVRVAQAWRAARNDGEKR